MTCISYSSCIILSLLFLDFVSCEHIQHPHINNSDIDHIDFENDFDPKPLLQLTLRRILSKAKGAFYNFEHYLVRWGLAVTPTLRQYHFDDIKKEMRNWLHSSYIILKHSPFGDLAKLIQLVIDHNDDE